MKLILFFLTILHGLCVLDLNAQSIGDESEVNGFGFMIGDSVNIMVEAVLNSKNVPAKYMSRVRTPVCADSLCHIMELNVYWDLLGNFLKYDNLHDSPLTKFDHDELTQEDHQKLYQILSSPDSPLRDYKKEDLVQHNVTIPSQVVDGVSGATNTSIQPYVVEGALYSTYTLWHIVNGPIAAKIKRLTINRLNDRMISQFLHSESYHEQYYALNNIKQINSQVAGALCNLIINGKEYIPLFAVDKLPIDYWNIPENQQMIFSKIDTFSFELQNEVIRKLDKIHVTSEGAVSLLRNCNRLKNNQIKNILKVVNSQLVPINTSVKETMSLLKEDTTDVELKTLISQINYRAN